jgi:hypothetical protein
MRKFVLIFGMVLSLCINAQAELYHGIDIDAIYESSDWSSKEDIRKIIDDYTLLLQYQKELNNCPIELPDVLECYDNVAEKIIKHFYVGDIDINLENYNNYIKATFASYGIVYCLNKYRIPSGSMCNQEAMGKTWKIIEQYNKDLLQSVEQILNGYSFLKDYKN